MKRFIYTLLLLFIFLGSLTNCKKSATATQTINVSGVVYDSVKNKALPFAKIYLYGAKDDYYGIFYDYGPLDSVFSDAQGKFSIQFNSDNAYIDYGLSFGRIVYQAIYTYVNNDNYVVNSYNPIYKFNHATNITNAVVPARELNYSKVRLTVLSNPYDTFVVSTTTAPDQLHYLIGHSIDTTIYVRHLPNTVSEMIYDATRYTPDSFYVHRQIRESFTATLADTLYFTKTISSIYSMPIH